MGPLTVERYQMCYFSWAKGVRAPARWLICVLLTWLACHEEGLSLQDSVFSPICLTLSLGALCTLACVFVCDCCPRREAAQSIVRTWVPLYCRYHSQSCKVCHVAIRARCNLEFRSGSSLCLLRTAILLHFPSLQFELAHLHWSCSPKCYRF